jgi:sec-independent protein translocase protein TatB
MFDIGFLELLICGVIALLVLGPERLPSAARAAGRWIGSARRMMGQFTSELDRELKAEELRQELRKAGDLGLEDVQKTVRDALNEAKKYENMVKPAQNQLDQANRNVTSALSELWDENGTPTISKPADSSPEKALDGTPDTASNAAPESPVDLNKPSPSSGDASDTRS